MAYFELNGYPCIDPASLAAELDALASAPIPADASSSEWLGKANAFLHRRGVDPSTGYFLVKSEAYGNRQANQLVINFDGAPSLNPQTNKPFTPAQLTQTRQLYSKAFKVSIEWARKASPASHENQGYYLVKVVDARYSLTGGLVGKRFNYVIGFNPGSSGQPGTFRYHQETVKSEPGSSGPIYRPYTWAELFDECFKLPNDPTLDKSEVTFPQYTPQDLDWRYVSHRDALQMLCQWCNVSILWDGLDGYKLVAVKDDNGSLAALLANYDKVITKNVFEKYYTPGIETPKQLELYFPILNPPSRHTSIYEVTKSSEYENNNGELLPLRLPCYKVEGAQVQPAQSLPTVAAAYKDLLKKLFDQFPPQEKIYSGLRYQPVGSSAVSAPNPLFQMKPSGFVESVIWFDLGRGPRTNLVSISRNHWLIDPIPVIQRGLVAAVGKVVGEVTESTPTIRVEQLRLINPSGSLPLGVSQLDGSYILSRNTFKKAYSNGDSILVFGEDYSQLWDTDNSGGTSGGSSIVRFELVEDDKLPQDFSGKAIILDAFGQSLDPDDPNNYIYVVDDQRKFSGYIAYDDPKYGQQRGYIGTASKLRDNFEFGNPGSPPGYSIIEMEATARWIEGRIAEDWKSGDNFGRIEIDKYWGAAPNNHSPKTEEHNFGGGTSQDPDDIRAVVKVYDPIDLLTGTIKKDKKVRAVWDEDREQYLLVTSLGEDYVRIKGRVTETVERSTGTIILTEVEEVCGPVPSGQIIVHNDPPIACPNGTVIHAMFDKSFDTSNGQNVNDSWTTADAANIRWLMHGFTKGTAAELVLEAGQGTDGPNWVNAGPC